MAAPPAGRWQWHRENTPALRDFVYLNCGWSGPMTTQVADAMRAFLDLELALGPTTKEVYEQRLALKDQYRELMAGVIGADPSEIAIAENTTEGLNIVLNGLEFRAGERIVTTGVEHASGIVPAYYLRDRRGADLRIVPLEGSDSPGEVLEKLEAAIGDGARMVILSEISYSTGQLLPLAGIVELAHRRGAQVLVDGAQTAGHLPLHVHESGVDYYAFTAHKWLCGPDGIGALYVREDLIPALEPAKVSGRAAIAYDDVGNFEPQRMLITKFELTTVSAVVIAGAVVAAAQYLESGPEAVFERATALNRYAEKRLSGLPGVAVVSPRSDDTRTGLFAFRLDGLDAGRVSSYLQQRWRIVCRSVPSQQAVRLSLHVYNDESDVDRVSEAVECLLREGMEDADAGQAEG
jgi:L-cysteine/cystine lyase